MMMHGYSQLRQAPDVQIARQAITREQQHEHQEWWKVETDAAVDRVVVAANHRLLQDELRRFEQNVWLGKHAKQKRFEFSAGQKKMLRQWFDALDADGSGKISVEELEDPMLSIGIVTDPKEIGEIVSRLDKDANGLIDFHEFVDFLTPSSKHGSLEKHEAMFMRLTKKMEHQSSGFLEINTQLSMERRRFILDAITKRSSQSIMEELGDFRKTHKASIVASEFEAGVNKAKARYLTTVARNKKLSALKERQQAEVRFQALEKVFERNEKTKMTESLPMLPSANTAYTTTCSPQIGAGFIHQATAQTSINRGNPRILAPLPPH